MSTPRADSSFRGWHLLILGALAAVTAALLRVPDITPAKLLVLAATIFAAAMATVALYLTIHPLFVRHFSDRVDVIGGRTRAAIEREKTLALRAIKELEFDHAMGKLSDHDFVEMASRLRARARRLLTQLDTWTGEHREAIERELASRLASPAEPQVAPDARRESTRPACLSCDTTNDPDARFCKSCGRPLRTA